MDELSSLKDAVAEVKKEDRQYQVENFLLAVFMKLEKTEKDLLEERNSG